jgi:peptidyl-prolyl cis-trans isomerase SurA
MAYSLKINEISPVFETEYGYHIMQLLDLKGEDYIVNHILVSPHFSSDSLDAAALRLEECYKKLRANEITWEQAVKKYSNDPATKENKGYIINPITGEQKWDVKDVNEVDPQMFLMTDALSTGDITAPSLYFDFNERKEAIRILRISERTQPHIANLKDDYTMFRQLAEEDKRQKAIDAWTKSRISSAYIRIDDEFKTCEFKNEWLPKL